MLTFLKGALKKLPPFKSLLQQRQSLQARLTSAEEQLQAAQAELDAIHAQIPNFAQLQRTLGTESIATALERYSTGYRFRSALTTHPYGLTASDWKHLDRGYADEAKIQEWMKQVRNYTLVTYDGLLSLADQVRYCETNSIPGCYVEAGTWKGGASALMALANLEYGKSRRQFYLFDSFQGIPEPDAVLDDIPWIQNEMKLPLDQCNGKLRSVDCIVHRKKTSKMSSSGLRVIPAKRWTSSPAGSRTRYRKRSSAWGRSPSSGWMATSTTPFGFASSTCIRFWSKGDSSLSTTGV